MPLSDVRVIELGCLPAASFCARLFADFGADVIKVEPAGGDPGRRTAPLIDIGSGQSEGAFFSFLNVRKRSVAMAHAAHGLPDLLADADVLVDSLSEAERRALGIDHEALKKVHPRLVVLGMSWFGDAGPYSGFAGTDAVCRALAGAVQLVGPVAGPPVPVCDYQASNVTGLTAFIAAMAVLQAPAHGGRRIEVNALESTIALADYNVALSWAAGERDRRWGTSRFSPNYPLGIYPCKEGWIGVTVVTPVQWRTFCRLLGVEDLAADPRYVERRGRLTNADVLEARFSPAFLQKTASEWFALALENMLPMVVVPSVEQVLALPEHRRREVFEEVRHGVHTHEAPACPLRLSATPPLRGGSVPACGEHAPAWRDGRREAEAGAAAPGSASGNVAALPLAGVRVVDLSMGWAGPLATRHFADLGAEVIKVEACQYPDWWRGVDDRPIVFEQRLYEKSAYFNVLNRNKRGITLDLTTPEGVDLVKRLLADADVVIDNYSAGVLAKLGLGHDTLERINPRLVMLSMPAFAIDGPWREARAYGSTLEQAAGLPSVAGLPGDPPTLTHIAYGDPIGGLHAASALLVALHHARRTGTGQRIVLSQVECMLTMLAPWIVEQSATGHVSPRAGRGHPEHAPHGCYRCKGDDAWLLVAVTSDPQWQSLCEAIDRPDLATDPAFLTREGRRSHSAEIDAAIEAWTLRVTPDAGMHLLQAQGVPAGASLAPDSLLDDPHLNARGFWQWIPRAHVGLHPQPSPPYRDAYRPVVPMQPAPTLGQFNAEVLKGLLELTETEIESLADRGIIGTEAVPTHRRKSRASTGSGGKQAAYAPSI